MRRRRRGRTVDADASLGAVLDASGELAAGRVDVLAARLADRRHEAGVQQGFLEREDPRARARPERRARERIPRDQVELAGDVADEGRRARARGPSRR